MSVPKKSMRLQKQFSRKVDDVEYSKYVLVIPQDAIKELNWKDKQELEFEIKDKQLVIKKAEK